MIDAPAPILPAPLAQAATARLLEKLQNRHIVLVGLMGAGKTSVGKRLAQRLGPPFVDSDHAIEESARMSIPEIWWTPTGSGRPLGPGHRRACLL